MRNSKLHFIKYLYFFSWLLIYLFHFTLQVKSCYLAGCVEDLLSQVSPPDWGRCTVRGERRQERGEMSWPAHSLHHQYQQAEKRNWPAKKRCGNDNCLIWEFEEEKNNLIAVLTVRGSRAERCHKMCPCQFYLCWKLKYEKIHLPKNSWEFILYLLTDTQLRRAAAHISSQLCKIFLLLLEVFSVKIYLHFLTDCFHAFFHLDWKQSLRSSQICMRSFTAWGQTV